jgi:hypothetical protein
MRSTFPTVLTVLLAAAGVVYALLMVASDLHHVSDELDVVARQMTAMAEDVRSIADDVNAIADSLAPDEDDDGQRQSTVLSGRPTRPSRLRRARMAVHDRSHRTLGIAAVAR